MILIIPVYFDDWIFMFQSEINSKYLIHLIIF